MPLYFPLIFIVALIVFPHKQYYIYPMSKYILLSYIYSSYRFVVVCIFSIVLCSIHYVLSICILVIIYYMCIFRLFVQFYLWYFCSYSCGLFVVIVLVFSWFDVGICVVISVGICVVVFWYFCVYIWNMFLLYVLYFRCYTCGIFVVTIAAFSLL